MALRSSYVVGRAEILIHGSFVPEGTLQALDGVPTAQVVGYFRSSCGQGVVRVCDGETRKRKDTWVTKVVSRM